MAWFGVGSGSRAKPQRAQRFVQADRVVMEVFADLHEARHLRSKFPAMSRGALQEFERKAWNRLIDYLIRLPPLRTDD
jgi:vacuolar-type H+-ATPase catalytic subunit A/Vma1